RTRRHRIVGASAPAPRDRRGMDVRGGRGPTPPDPAGLEVFRLAVGRWSARLVYRRVWVHLFALALECGNEVFPTNSTAGLLLLVEWRASGRFFGKEQAPLARCRMAAGVRGAGDRCLVLDTGIWDRPAHATWRPARRDLIPDVVALGDCRGVDGMGEFRLVGPNLSLAAMFFPPARSPANNSDARLTTPRRSRGNRPDYNGTGAADRTRARQHESQFRRELGPGGC